MNRKIVTSRIVEAGAIAIVRVRETLALEPAAEALVRGGITVLEVTCTTPNALPTIEALRQCYGRDLLVGAGSVITEQQVKDVVSAGACFVVSPVTKKGVIDAAHAFDLPVLPGALTPTEAQVADDLGADMVKIFPAGQLGFSYVESSPGPVTTLEIGTDRRCYARECRKVDSQRSGGSRDRQCASRRSSDSKRPAFRAYGTGVRFVRKYRGSQAVSLIKAGLRLRP